MNTSKQAPRREVICRGLGGEQRRDICQNINAVQFTDIIPKHICGGIEIQYFHTLDLFTQAACLFQPPPRQDQYDDLCSSAQGLGKAWPVVFASVLQRKGVLRYPYAPANHWSGGAALWIGEYVRTTVKQTSPSRTRLLTKPINGLSKIVAFRSRNRFMLYYPSSNETAHDVMITYLVKVSSKKRARCYDY